MNRPGATSMHPSSRRLLLPPCGGTPSSWRLSSHLPGPRQPSAPRRRRWCVSPAPSGPGCSAPSRVSRGLVTGPGFSLSLLASLPPVCSLSPSGPAGLLLGWLLALGVRLGLPWGLRHSGALGRVSVWSPWLPLELCLQVCPEGSLWTSLKGWACQPSRRGDPWGGLWASGCCHGSGRWSVFLSGVGHAGSREADGSEGAGVRLGHEVRAWAWGCWGPKQAGGVRTGGVGWGTVLDVAGGSGPEG